MTAYRLPEQVICGRTVFAEVEVTPLPAGGCTLHALTLAGLPQPVSCELPQLSHRLRDNQFFLRTDPSAFDVTQRLVRMGVLALTGEQVTDERDRSVPIGMLDTTRLVKTT